MTYMAFLFLSRLPAAAHPLLLCFYYARFLLTSYCVEQNKIDLKIRELQKTIFGRGCSSLAFKTTHAVSPLGCSCRSHRQTPFQNVKQKQQKIV